MNLKYNMKICGEIRKKLGEYESSGSVLRIRYFNLLNSTAFLIEVPDAAGS